LRTDIGSLSLKLSLYLADGSLRFDKFLQVRIAYINLLVLALGGHSVFLRVSKRHGPTQG
jgi:hypothetical protein